MGKHMLVGGEWDTEVSARAGDVGPKATLFSDRIRDDPDARFPAERGRYHIYVSYACPWAHGALLVRRLTSLTDIVSMDVVDPYRGEGGWQFTPEKRGCTRDSVNGYDYLRETYTTADPGFTGQVTVPVLWDREVETIVNNESIDIMRMLDAAFDDYSNDVDLYPEGYRNEIDRIVNDLYENVNRGVYRAGFAETQDDYDDAVADLFTALDHWDGVLADQRYLAGDRLTLADLRLFPTLVRFDEVYHTHFKCNRQLIREYDHLWPYLRDLYQIPGIVDTVWIDHIKGHYYRTHPSVNPSGLVPTGPNLDFEATHDRETLPGSPPAPLLNEGPR